MICCVSKAKINISGRKIDRRMTFMRNFMFFQISEFFMILRCSGYEFRLPGLISCPEQVPNQPGMEFQANSDFRVYMLFMRRPNYQPNCLKKWSPDHGAKTERCVYICCWAKNWSAVDWTFRFYAYFTLVVPVTGFVLFFFRCQLAARRSRITL